MVPIRALVCPGILVFFCKSLFQLTHTCKLQVACGDFKIERNL